MLRRWTQNGRTMIGQTQSYLRINTMTGSVLHDTRLMRVKTQRTEEQIGVYRRKTIRQNPINLIVQGCQRAKQSPVKERARVQSRRVMRRVLVAAIRRRIHSLLTRQRNDKRPSGRGPVWNKSRGVTRRGLVVQNTRVAGRLVRPDKMMTTKSIDIIGKRRNIETVGGRETNYGGPIADIGTTDRDSDEQTPTDTNGRVTATTERSRGLKNDRERRGRDPDPRKLVTAINHIVSITSHRHQQQPHPTHITAALNVASNIRRGIKKPSGSRVIVIGPTENGLVRSPVTSAGLDPRQGTFQQQLSPWPVIGRLLWHIAFNMRYVNSNYNISAFLML